MQEINTNQVGRVIAIRYQGKMYDHYGILDGKDGVIHVHKKKGKITIDPLERVLIGAKKVTTLDDDFDTRWKQYEHAMTLVGSPHQYKFFTENCETWVQKIRTGKAFSKQVDMMSNTISTLVLGISAILAVGKSFSPSSK